MQLQQKFWPNQRLDLPQMDSLLGLIDREFQGYNRILFSQNLVLKGFTLIQTGALQVSLDTTVDSALAYPEREATVSGVQQAISGGGLNFYNANYFPPVSIDIADNATNYVEAQIVETTSFPETVTFWDKTANSGVGTEFSQSVDLILEQAVVLVSNTVGFTGDPDKVPLAEVVASGGGITAINDMRDMFFSNRDEFDFGDPRTDEGIVNFKDMFDALMSVIAEIKQDFWYAIPKIDLTETNKLINTQLQILPGATPNLVTITGADVLLNMKDTREPPADTAILGQELDELFLSFTGASIDFATGIILDDKGAPLGVNFTPFPLSVGSYVWYSIGLEGNITTAINATTCNVIVLAAESENTDPTLAPYPEIGGTKKLGAVLFFNKAAEGGGSTVTSGTEGEVWPPNYDVLQDNTGGKFSSVQVGDTVTIPAGQMATEGQYTVTELNALGNPNYIRVDRGLNNASSMTIDYTITRGAGVGSLELKEIRRLGSGGGGGGGAGGGAWRIYPNPRDAAEVYQIAADGFIPLAKRRSFQLWQVRSVSGKQVMSLTPFGTDAYWRNGDVVRLMGTDDVNVPVLKWSNIVGGANVNGDVELYKGKEIELQYYARTLQWEEASRNH